MELFKKFIFYSACVAVITAEGTQNAMEQNLYPVYIGPKTQLNGKDATSRKLDNNILSNNSDTILSPQNVQPNVAQPGISNIDPNKVVFVNVSRGPSKYHTSNLQINQQHKLNNLRQLTDDAAAPITNLNLADQFNNQRHIITAPINNAQLSSGQPNKLINQPTIFVDQDTDTKPEAIDLNDPIPNKFLSKSLPSLSISQPNSIQLNQYPPSNVSVNRQLPIATSNHPTQLPFKKSQLPSLDNQFAQSNSLMSEERSSYSSYVPQISNNKFAEADRKWGKAAYNSAPTYIQQPNGNYDLQYLPDYNPESELSEKLDDEESLDDYLDSTAGFINGAVITIYALGLSLLLLAIITATTVGRKKREVEMPQEGFTWQLTDMIHCVSRFYCEMEQWDQKYPPPPTPSNESAKKEKLSKDRTPRKAPIRRKNCAEDYRTCPVNFTLMRTLWRMFR